MKRPAHPHWLDGSPVLVGQLVNHNKFGPRYVESVHSSVGYAYVTLARRWYQPKRYVPMSKISRIMEA